MAKHNKRLKFALMCNSTVVQQWQIQAVDALLEAECAEPVLLILPEEQQPEAKRSLIWRFAGYPWSKVIFRKYYQYCLRPESFKRTELNPGITALPRLYCKPELKGKYSQHFSPQDIETIRSYQPDFILKFGFGIIRGEILNCTPYGIWSFHHGNVQKYRGIPPAFHEICNNDPYTVSVLQRLTAKLDGGIILRRGVFKTIGHSWQANLDQALSLSAGWPALVCREIIAGLPFPDENHSAPTTAPIYREPGNGKMVRFLIRQFANKLKFHLQELFLAEKWSTGIIRAETRTVAEETTYVVNDMNVRWLNAKGRNRYFADSFAIQDGDRLLLLFEDYDYRRLKGMISAAQFNLKDETFGEVSTALEEPWHLSYPFVFSHNGNDYCIPESKDHGSVELYGFDRETLKLSHIRTLLPGVLAADPTLIFHEGRWYLFFSPARATNTELHIWHSESLDGPFVPHRLNPVKANVRSSRPAGQLFRIGNKLYRPAQDCSRTYGGRIVVNEIKALNEEVFIEGPAFLIEPPKGFKGLHNLSPAGEYLCFDSKRFVFSAASFRNQLRKRLGLKKNVPPVTTGL